MVYKTIKENDEDKAIIVFQYAEMQYVDEKGNVTNKDAENKTLEKVYHHYNVLL